MKQVRHGDLFLQKIKRPENLVQARSRVLALGEATGHRHEVVKGDVYVDEDGSLVVHATKPTTLEHLTSAGTQADHKLIDLPTGWWRVTVEREWDPWRETEAGQVVD